MRRLQVFIFILSLLSPWATAGEVRTDLQKDLDEMTRRLISAHLETEVNEEAIARYMNQIRTDGSFPDLDYVATYEGAYFPCGAHLKRLSSMTVAYRKPESKYHASGKLLNKIVAGLDYWYKVRPLSKNWWFNEIGAPQDYMVALILLKDKISDKKLLHYSFSYEI